LHPADFFASHATKKLEERLTRFGLASWPQLKKAKKETSQSCLSMPASPRNSKRKFLKFCYLKMFLPFTLNLALWKCCLPFPLLKHTH
jgi:hypothetical protein